MTERNDGSWDAPTAHDDARGEADMTGDDAPTMRATDAQRVVLLDRVSGRAPTDYAPTRGDAAAGGIVVVATGADADRVRKLCHKHGLLVPVMASLSVVHDAMSVVVIGEPSPPAPERVVHVVRPALPDDRLVELLRALAGGRVIVEPPVATTVASAASSSDPQVVEAARRLASVTDRAAIETITSEVIVALTGADRAHCLFHDPATGALWSEARRCGSGDERRAMGGLVGWAAQTGHTIHASPAGDDPRWLQELDDPGGKPQSRVLVQPIIGADRRVHAVLVAVRRWRDTDFSEPEQQALAAFAALAGPALDLAVAASPAPAAAHTRAPRSTLPGAMGPASVMSPSAKSAVVATPRAASDSRPPPVTARAGSGTAPPPMASKRPAASLVPLVEEAARLDETRRDDADPEVKRASAAVADKGSPVASSESASGPVPIVDKRSGSLPIADKRSEAVAGSDTRSGRAATTDERSGPVPVADKGSVARADQRSGPAPITDKRSGPVALAERRTGPGRARTATEGPRHPRATSDPRDLAVVASADDAKRVDRIAKKARLELSTFAKLADAPEFYEVVTIGETWSPHTDARIAYAARSTITDDQLADLLVGLTSGRAVVPAAPLTSAQSVGEARRSQLAFAAARKLAAVTDLAAAEEIATTTLHDLLDIDRAYCLFAHPDTGALWSERRRHAGGDDRRAIAGIAGWVARTGRTANVARASADPRWLAPIDDPDGDPNSQLLLQPLVHSDGRVHGVLVAVRRPRRPGFTETDVALLSRFAALAAPLFEQLAVYLDTQSLVGEDTSARPALPAAPDPLWLAIVRGRHPLARWIFLALGALLGLIIGLLA